MNGTTTFQPTLVIDPKDFGTWKRSAPRHVQPPKNMIIFRRRMCALLFAIIRAVCNRKSKNILAFVEWVCRTEHCKAFGCSYSGETLCKCKTFIASPNFVSRMECKGHMLFTSFHALKYDSIARYFGCSTLDAVSMTFSFARAHSFIYETPFKTVFSSFHSYSPSLFPVTLFTLFPSH